MKKKSILFLSEFILKIIGLLTMTIDHVGVFLQASGINNELTFIFRLIGRISFPLFVFIVIEGIRYTRNFWKYLLRLGILGSLMIASSAVLYQYYNALQFSSPITDLIFIALAIYLINRKDKLSFLSILPIGYLCLCFGVNLAEASQNINVVFLPKLVRCDYSIFGLILGFGFYFAPNISKLFLESKQETKNLTCTPIFRITQNIISALVIIVVSLTYYILIVIGAPEVFVPYTEYAFFAAMPLFFYTGARGYNAKWFKYGCYAYFPLHLILIFVIFYLTGLLII